MSERVGLPNVVTRAISFCRTWKVNSSAPNTSTSKTPMVKVRELRFINYFLDGSLVAEISPSCHSLKVNT